MARVLPLALVFLAMASCSRSADVSGDVFVALVSGDVKRGAGLEVSLVEASQDFERDWESMAADHRKAMDARAADHQRARASGDESSAAYDAWIQANADFMGKALELIRKHTVRRERSDVNGHYSIAGVPRGRYLLYSRFTVGRDTVRWLVPVELSSSSTKVDLADANMEAHGRWPFGAEFDRALLATTSR